MALTQLSIRKGNVPTPVNATPGGSLFTNGGPSSVYYGPTSSVASGDGTEITSGGTATLAGTQYLVLASTGTLAKVSITPTYQGDEEDFLVANQLQVTGNTAVGGTIAVTGASTLTGAVSAAKVSGTGLAVAADATVGGTLAVTGAASCAALTATGVAVGGALTTATTGSFSGAVGTGALTVTGAATVSTTLAVTGALTALGRSVPTADAATQKIITGRVSSAGALVTGSGWTVVRNGAGDYTVTFTSAFSVVPSATATAEGAGNRVTNSEPTASTVRVVISAGATGTNTDTAFNFVAVGTA